LTLGNRQKKSGGEKSGEEGEGYGREGIACFAKYCITDNGV
jgi:hypothetical protein